MYKPIVSVEPVIKAEEKERTESQLYEIFSKYVE